MNYKTKDGLSEAIDRLRSELGVIKEELRIIDMRKPALESRSQRIGEALQTLIGDGSTGDPRWLQLPRITEGGIERIDPLSLASEPMQYVQKTPKHKVGPATRPEISDEAVLAMADFAQRSTRPVKSSELYENLLSKGLMVPIETEMPYKSFAITLRNIRQDFIEYDRASKTWSLKDRSPKAKLREALEKSDGTRVVSSHSIGVPREEHAFVKAVNGVFKEHRWEPMGAGRLYDELSEKRDFGLIPGAGNLADFTSTLGSYNDFFSLDEATGNYRSLRPETPAKQDFSTGVQGLYTVKSNGGVNTMA